MNTSSINDFFHNWNNRYNDLMSLPLYIIYDKFSSNYSYTPSGYDLCSDIIQNNTPDFGEFRKVCRAAEKTLNSLDSENYQELENCKPYEYISYFLYDKIKNIDTKNSFEELYGILDTILIYPVKGKKCDIIRFDLNNDEFDKKKELYLNGEILHWIKLKNEDVFYFDKDFCKNYINKCFNFYTQKIKDSYCKEFKHYEEELKKFSNNFNETMKFLKTKQIDIKEEEIQLPLKTECSSGEHSAQLIEEPKLVQGGKYIAEDSNSYNPEPVSIGSPNADTNVTAGTVSGTLIGISFLSLLFWKFTPLGSRIQHKIWDKGNNYNLEHQNDEIILDTSTNEDIYSYKNKYNIQYHSA